MICKTATTSKVSGVKTRKQQRASHESRASKVDEEVEIPAATAASEDKSEPVEVQLEADAAERGAISTEPEAFATEPKAAAANPEAEAEVVDASVEEVKAEEVTAEEPRSE